MHLVIFYKNRINIFEKRNVVYVTFIYFTCKHVVFIFKLIISIDRDIPSVITLFVLYIHYDIDFRQWTIWVLNKFNILNYI